MHPVARVFLYKGEEKFFGEGPYRLLHGVQHWGSLRAAALEMGMSYSKAIALINRAERLLGFALTEKTIGGRSGGGSRLTPEAIDFLAKYELYREECYEANRRIYSEIFSK